MVSELENVVDKLIRFITCIVQIAKKKDAGTREVP